MRYMKFAGVLVAAIVVASCADSTPSPVDPQPDLRFVKSTLSICDAASNREIKAQQEALFAGSDLRAIQRLWSAVTNKCSTTNQDAANTELLHYVRSILGYWSGDHALILGTTDDAKAILITAHFDKTFSFVGYADPDLRKELLIGGAAKVITSADLANLPDGGSIEFGIPATAAMTVSKQLNGGDSRGHLFVLYEVTPTVTNPCLQNVGGLDQIGDCIEFSAFPKPPTGTDFNPLLKVGVCSAESARNGALGHFDTGAPRTTVLTPIHSYPSDEFCLGTAPLPRFGAAGIFDRFARVAHALFAPNVAYATHAGLGGLTPCCSFFQVVDQSVFSATFSTPLVPGDTLEVGPLPGTDRGAWTKVLAQSPGSITVAGSLADMADQPVVLNQGGGACGDACGGLDLWGQIKTAAGVTAVSAGKYSVSWTSVQNHSNPKLAPFVIRSSTNDTIATLAYARVSGVNQLLYNGVVLADVTWAKGAKQNFEIIVDFTSTTPATIPIITPTTTLKVNGNAYALNGNAYALNKLFVGAATDLSKVQAEFSGIDSGIVGWDNIIIDRIPDR